MEIFLFSAGMLSGIAIAYAAFRCWKRVLKNHKYSFIAALMPPDDFHENLFEVKLPLTGDQASIEVVYSHRYAGTYRIGLVCERRIDNPIKTPLIRVQVRTKWKYPGGKIIAEKDEMISLKNSWWNRATVNGFELFSYDPSEIIPVDERISLEIVIDNCNEVIENCGAFSVYGRHQSCI
jgi:hypothetical protein